MKNMHQHFFWVSLSVCMLPENILTFFTPASLLFVFTIKILWFLVMGGLFAEDLLKRKITVEPILFQFIAMVIALNLNYFIGRSDAFSLFKIIYMVFFTTFMLSVVFVSIEIVIRKLFQKVVRKNKKPLY